MKINWFSKNSKFDPIVILIALSVVQFIHAQWSLQLFNNRADRNYETLDKRMLRDNVPSNVKEHIIYVQKQSTFSTDLLVDSLSFMQIFVQIMILLVFWSFFLRKNQKLEGDEKSEQ